MDILALLTVVLGLVLVGLISGRLQGSVVTGIMLVTAFGFAIGPAGAGLVGVQLSYEGLRLLAEVTLILVLFTDAASTDLRQLRRDHHLPLRMLLIGLPATVALGGTVAALCIDALTPFEALLLAAILAPTDAALGQAVISDQRVPVRIRMSLNVESGLNDGLALPLVVILVSIASAMDTATGAADWLRFGLAQVTLGPLAGVAVGYAGAKLVSRASDRGWMTPSAEGMVGIGIALASFATAELLHGNGFIAAFVAGLTFGNTLNRRCRFLYEFAESEGQIFVLLTFMAFGALMIPQALTLLDWRHLVFAVLALTLLRMLPVYLSLTGSGTRPVTRLFLGWFGPRGLASVLFVLLILEEAEIGHRDELFTAAVATIVLSIFLHGMTAGPAARRYGALASRMGECAERMPVSDQPFSNPSA